jgi:imidazolonepropionase-like amidohydrolase
MKPICLWALFCLLAISTADSLAQTPATVEGPSTDSQTSYQFISNNTRIIIAHITVIDTKNGRRLFNRNVEIIGGRIAAISNGGFPKSKNTRIIDGRRKFLIPGLWDMEVHLSWCKESAIPLLIANGVTDVRDMGGDFDEIERWRTEISSGQMIGPHILQVGPMLNGESFNKYQLAARDSGETRGIVRTLKFIGVDGLEVERRLSKNVYMVLMDEAKRQGLPVGGHVQLSTSPEEASNAGQRTIENMESLYYGTFANGIAQKDLPGAIDKFLSSTASDTLFKIFVRNHTAVTPVLNTFDWSINQLRPNAAVDANSRYVALSLKQEAAKAKMTAENLVLLKTELPALMHTTDKMYCDGVIILAGTDIAGARVPGFSLHSELEELVKAGLSPLAALQTATINPAIVLGIDSDYGSIEAGKIANLVVLDADPLTNIENTRKISGVIVGGKYLNLDAIHQLLKKAETQAIKE